MRFSVDILCEGKNQFTIPTNYRRNITSLIKEAINPQTTKENSNNDSEFYLKYYGNKNANIQKPFTFSLYIPNPKVKKSGKNHFLEFEKNIIKFFFSSTDYEFLLHMYNGLLKLNKNFSPFNFPIRIKNFQLLKEKKFNASKIIYKTLSPLIVRKLENHKGKGYVTFEDQLFKQMLFHTVNNQYRNFISNASGLDQEMFNINPVRCKNVKIYHYNEVIKATNGILEIEAPQNVLKLIYEAGLGAKRSQGFGMLEVV